MYENMILVEKGFPKIGGMEFWAKRCPFDEGLFGGLLFCELTCGYVDAPHWYPIATQIEMAMTKQSIPLTSTHVGLSFPHRVNLLMV